MPLVRYQNYETPFADAVASASLAKQSFAQPPPPPIPGGVDGSSWVRRNWAVLMQVLGYVFLIGGTIGQQVVDKTVPPEEKIAPDDWDMIIQAMQRQNPTMSRADIITKLCQLFGSRAPFCEDIYFAPPLPPPGPLGGLPSWVWLVGLGVGAFLLLK